MTKEFSFIDIGIAVGVTGALCCAIGLAGIAEGRAEAEQRYQQGYEQGKIEGFKEAQSADLIADRCVAFWFGSEREGARALDKFCERKDLK